MAINGIPVVWKPSPDFNVGRFGLQPKAIVHHRAVSSSLAGIDATLVSSSRLVSAHFGIGDYNGHVEIHQYVDLSDTAWCNGDWRSPSSWVTWYGTPKTLSNGFSDVNPQTISIEHDDNGGSADPLVKGIVTEAIIKASIALDKLLLSGDLAAIRAAGIHCRDASTAAALKAMPIDAKHLIDHKDIAGANKPYCWRPWQADKVGFPRARYIAETARVVAPPPPPPPPATTYTQAQVDAIVKAAVDPLKAALAEADAVRAAAVLQAKRDQYDVDKANAEASPIQLGPRP